MGGKLDKQAKPNVWFKLRRHFQQNGDVEATEEKKLIQPQCKNSVRAGKGKTLQSILEHLLLFFFKMSFLICGLIPTLVPL